MHVYTVAPPERQSTVCMEIKQPFFLFMNSDHVTRDRFKETVEHLNILLRVRSVERIVATLMAGMKTENGGNN